MFNHFHFFKIIIFNFFSFLLLCPQSNIWAAPKKSLTTPKSIQRISYTTSSDFSEEHLGCQVLDNNPKTSWISQNKKEPHWIEIDFKTKRIITAISIQAAKKNKTKTLKYCFLKFKYKKKWFTFRQINFLKNNQYKFKQTIDLGGLDASIFRILIPPEATYNGLAALAEIEIYIGQTKLEFYDQRLKNLFFPIKNGLLPKKDSDYPNAPRTYRGGRHVGIDIRSEYSESLHKIIPVSKETPVYSLKEGTIIRADWNYQPMTSKEWWTQSNYYKQHPRTFVKRSFGGRQVWIDHQNGIVSTYNHLSGIYDKIKKGKKVKKGELIGWVGNSGLLAESLNTDDSLHLHFEIWVDGYYLGWGMDIKEIKQYYQFIFSPSLR